jgi:asparagine synthase (glutamine-hydrolysing)
MTPLEEAFGLPFGRSGVADLVPARSELDPRGAIEHLVREALAKPPCLVAFSGGRDSSILLIVAAEIAAREAMAPPVPITYRFALEPSSEESEWQELVVRHLGLSDWERLDLTDELDLLGPYAQRLLLAHGNLFPFNVHFSAPMVERARGGTVITGSGGDEVFGTRPWPRAARLLGPSRSSAAHAAGRLLGAAPMPLRRWSLRDQLDAERPWMTREAAKAARKRWSSFMACHPVARDRAMREWLWPSRYWQLARQSLELVGGLWGATLRSPFMEPDFLDAAARNMGRSGYASRAEAIEGLLGTGVLPAPVLDRRTKATFDLAFFNHFSRDFVEGWHGDGSGVDPEVVDAEQLAREWHRATRPDARSYSLIKAVWLTRNRPSSTQDVAQLQR